MNKMAIICPLGGTGAVITETINAMIEKWLSLNSLSSPELELNLSEEQEQRLINNFCLDVFVLFTTGGAYRGKPSVLPKNKNNDAHLPENFSETEMINNSNIHILKIYKYMKKYYEETSDNKTKLYRPNKESFIKLPNVRLIAIPIQQWDNEKLGDILDDVRTTEQNKYFQLIMFGLHHCLLKKYPETFISLAGGRKSMSAYGMVSAMLFNPPFSSEDTKPEIPSLSHVLVKEQQLEKPDIYQLPIGTYDFESVPYFHLSDLTGVLLKELNVTIPEEFMMNGEEHELDEIIQNDDLFDLLKNDDFRSFLYKAGKVYEENLKGITLDAAQLIRQGIAFRAIKHELADKLSKINDPRANAIHGAIETISKCFDSKFKISSNNIKLCNIIDDAIKDFKSIKPNVEIGCTIDGDTEVSGDKTLLRHLFFNLIKNSNEAFQSLDKDGKPEISIKIKDTGNIVKIFYKDNGGGISQTDIHQVFQFGYSTKGSSNKGIGMFLCDQVMKLHKGKIEVENAGNGVCFIISFGRN